MNSSKKIKHYIENIEESCHRRLLGIHSVIFDSILTERDADDTCIFLPRGEFNKSLDRVDIYDSKEKKTILQQEYLFLLIYFRIFIKNCIQIIIC